MMGEAGADVDGVEGVEEGSLAGLKLTLRFGGASMLPRTRPS